jgi:hypothetical protein
VLGIGDVMIKGYYVQNRILLKMLEILCSEMFRSGTLHKKMVGFKFKETS